jgi:hypothetical protein
MSVSRKLGSWLFPVLVVLFTFAVFWRTLGFGLYLDDNHHARPWTLAEVLGTFNGPFDPLGIEPPYFRPLPVVSFALDWALWGWGTGGYHFTNVALHALASLLVLLLLRRMRVPELPACLGALYFSVIPANVATAVYISERSDALVVIFVCAAVLSVHTYVATHRSRWLWLMGLCACAAMSSKEIGASVALLTPLFWLYFTLDQKSRAEPSPGGSAPAGIVNSAARLRDALLGLWREPATLGQVLRVGLPLFFIVVIYALHRVRVLPTGLISAHYGDVGPLRGYASAIFWTFRAVPWEVPAPLLLPLVALVTLLALLSRPSERAWAVTMMGLLTIALSSAPLGLLGQVEPRLLYLPEVGHAVMMAGVAMALTEASRVSGPGLRRAAGMLGWGAGLALAVVIAAAHLRAQNEFRPDSYKMLKGYRGVIDDPKKNLYPRHRLDEVERILENARERDLDGAR